MAIDESEEKRLKILEDYEILGTAEEQIFDDITKAASYICGTPIALITLVSRDKQWFKSKVGVEISETPREVAFCAHAIKQESLFVVNDTLQDERFAENPLVTGDPNIRFYSGAPITTSEGYRLGTLCVIDDKPRKLTQEQQELLQGLSRQVINLLENHRARKGAEKENRLKDDFVATVAHELRAPLNTILNWANLIGAGKLDAERSSRAVEQIIRSAKSQSRLIKDLIDISQIVFDKIRLNIKSVELPPLVESVIESMSLAAEAKSISIESFIDQKVTAINGDYERLQQIFLNLLSNAIKFTPENGKIQVRLEKINSNLEFSVSDNGQSIKPEFLPYVFERFRQEQEDGISKSSDGLGLGLAIVRHLVEMHDGSIYAESLGAGLGATFKVTFPL